LNYGEEIGVKQFNEMSYDELHSHVESAVSALILTAYNLGKMDATAEKIQTPPIPSAHPQDIRDEIIEKSKMDVAELRNINGRYDVSDPHMFVPWSCNAEFIVNKEKRTVVALLRGYGSGNVYAKGIAKGAPTDCFNVHIGKAIALRRALGLEMPSEYLNAPQPTEVRVGDIVEYAGYKVTVMPSGKSCMYTKGTCADGSLVATAGKLIDDSREEVAE
jgi:hypothetical protein